LRRDRKVEGDATFLVRLRLHLREAGRPHEDDFRVSRGFTVVLDQENAGLLLAYLKGLAGKAAGLGQLTALEDTVVVEQRGRVVPALEDAIRAGTSDDLRLVRATGHQGSDVFAELEIDVL